MLPAAEKLPLHALLLMDCVLPKARVGDALSLETVDCPKCDAIESLQAGGRVTREMVVACSACGWSARAWRDVS